ncbi:TetR/AcrR family transcriptional regulator [Nocardia brasiliensis]|uniref:TetR/AcrR family transcriptional regulator n=1 Tax=Nocardia brasiliensis TaxID=37326 RepID=UPI002457F2A8|nr:helix-turn-helix domain-containing protein [Nocardia brasiliensis]
MLIPAVSQSARIVGEAAGSMSAPEARALRHGGVEQIESRARGGRLTLVDRRALPLGVPRAERADAVRNRQRLLAAARALIAEVGVDKVTMDGLAERSGLGKGSVFRHFGTRAGIFDALLDEDERAFQNQVMAGPPPLGPGADPIPRLIAFGRARITFLLDRQAIARAALDRAQPISAGAATLSRFHIRMLLGHACPDVADLDTLAVQLTAALEGPILLYLSSDEPAHSAHQLRRLAEGWQVLVERATTPRAG